MNAARECGSPVLGITGRLRCGIRGVRKETRSATKPENGPASEAGENTLERCDSEMWTREAWVEMDECSPDHSGPDKADDNLSARGKAAKPEQP